MQNWKTNEYNIEGLEFKYPWIELKTRNIAFNVPTTPQRFLYTALGAHLSFSNMTKIIELPDIKCEQTPHLHFADCIFLP